MCLVVKNLKNGFARFGFVLMSKLFFPAKNFEKHTVYMFGANLGPPFSTDRSNTFVMGVYIEILQCISLDSIYY